MVNKHIAGEDIWRNETDSLAGDQELGYKL